MSAVFSGIRLIAYPAALSGVFLALVLVGPALAAEPAGRVLDVDGKPVAGVTVSAIGRNWADPLVTASAKTGADGRFVLAGAWKLPELDLRYLGLLARADDGRLGWKSTIWRQDPTSQDLTITLEPTGEASARLLDQDGKPLSDAPIVVAGFDRSDRAQGRYDDLTLPEALSKTFQVRSDRDGRFVLKGVPQGAKLWTRVDDRRVGKPSVMWDPAKVTSLTLDTRLGTIPGRLVTPDGKDLPEKVKVSVRRSGAAAEGASVVTLHRSAAVEKNGHFRFPDLPPGSYALELEIDPEVPYSGSRNQAITLEPGKPLPPVEIALEKWPVVTGRIVDEATGEGIAGVSLRASQLDRNTLRNMRMVKTDAKGRYAVAVHPGTTLIQPDEPPRSHLGMMESACPRLEVTQNRTWPDLKLTRAAHLNGFVVDPAGKPIAGAEVRLTVPTPFGIGDSEMIPPSGADGQFQLEQIDPTDAFAIRARTADAVTQGGIVIRPGVLNPPGKFTLTIDRNWTARLTGRIVDPRGRPVADVPVTIWWNRIYVSEKTNKGMGLGSVLDAVRTGADGRFRTKALWPGDRFHITVDFPPYAKAETPQVSLSAGEVHDVGTIALVDASAAVAGVVVGSDGKPIAGVEVFNRGDGPKPVSTRTGPDGRFRLEGLYAGSKFAFARRDGFRRSRLADAMKVAQTKFLFARKDGYRFGGLAVEGEPQDISIRLLKADENPAPWAPRPGASWDEEKAFARQTLERIWETIADGDPAGPGRSVVSRMAELDPDRASAWSAHLGNLYDDEVRSRRASRLAETDAAAAIRVLREKDDTLNAELLQEFSERIAESAPGQAVVLAEEALKLMKDRLGVPRARILARVGSTLRKLGRAQEGESRIAEAAEIAAKLPANRESVYLRGVVAGALAKFDPKRALALVEPITDKEERARALGPVLEAMGGKDPDQALRLVETLDTRSSQPETVRKGIAYALAPRDSSRAVQIVEAMKGYSPEKHQAEAFGWLAVAIAPKERSKAYALIDRALAMPIDRPEGFGSWTYFGGGLASAAGIALNARKIGYPDMEGVIWRVLAARPDGQHGFNDPAMQTQSLTVAAPLVALLDPQAAATILGQLEARSGLGPADLANISGDWWLAAWALADLKHAEGLIDARLEAMKAAQNPEAVQRGLDQMLEVLLTPPDRREELLRRRIGASWRPGGVD